MQYTSPAASYQSGNSIEFVHDGDDYEERRRNEYSRRQSFKALRKKARRKSAEHYAGPGIGGRRNRHYTW